MIIELSPIWQIIGCIGTLAFAVLIFVSCRACRECRSRDVCECKQNRKEKAEGVRYEPKKDSSCVHHDSRECARIRESLFDLALFAVGVTLGMLGWLFGWQIGIWLAR